MKLKGLWWTWNSDIL